MFDEENINIELSVKQAATVLNRNFQGVEKVKSKQENQDL